MKKIEAISNPHYYFGYFGEKTSVEHIKVGDVIGYIKDGIMELGLVVKDERKDFVMGWGMSTVKEFCEQFPTCRVMVKGKYVESGLAKSITDDYLTVTEVTKMPMTLAQIEEELGYEIELIEE